MIRIFFAVYSWVFLIMGILGLVPGVPLGAEPEWYALLKIILGLVGILIAMKKKHEE